MEIRSPALQQLFAHWALCTPSPYPRRAAFGLSDLRFVLGGMSLIEVYYEPLRFLYRSQGAEITAWLGFDLTGKFIEQCANPRWAARTLEQLRDVVITGAPAIAWHLDEMVGHQCWNIEALVLPISRDGTNLDMLISAVERHRHDADKHGRLVAAPLPRKPAHATLRAP